MVCDNWNCNPRKDPEMKHLSVCLTAISAVMLYTGTCIAKESKWIGPATDGVFFDEANWNNGVPGAGDVAVFDTATVLIGKGQGNLDCGTQGLTIRNSASVKLGNRLAGSGALIKAGSGELTYAASNWDKQFTGGVRVEEGKFILQLKDTDSSGVSLKGKSTEIFGKGAFTVMGSGIFRVDGWGSTVDSPIVVTNHRGGNAIESNGQMTWAATISGDCDFGIYNSYEVMSFGGTVTAPGKTVTLSAVNWNWKWCGYSAVFDCNVVLDTQNDTIQLQGKSLNPANTLTVKTQRIEMGGGATWGGRVVVKNGAKLKTTGGKNFIETTGVTIENGGVIDVLYNTSVRRLTLGAEMQVDGAYSKDNASGKITNNGSIVVDSSIKLWTGAADKVWSNGENWDGGVPVSGQTAIFPYETTLAADAVDVGDSGLTLDCRGDVGGPVVFGGSGKLVKRGSGKFTTGGKYTLTGGVSIEEGQIYETMSGTGFNYMADALGAGTIEITGSGSLYISAYMSTNTQAIVIRDHDGSVAPLQTSGSVVNLGTVTADSDFTINNTWDTPRFLGKISAPGKTVTLKTANWNTAWYYADTEIADIDAHLVLDMKNGKPVVLSGAYERRSNNMSVISGKVTIPVGQRWGALNFSAGTTVTVAEKQVLACSDLNVAGVAKTAGYYRADKLPGVLMGTGRILVGSVPGLTIILR